MTAAAVALAAAIGLLGSFGTKGSGDGQFRFPSDLAVDSAGNVYVADQDNQRIQKLAPDGRLLAKFGSGSLEEGQTAPGTFDDPSGIAVDPAGNMWVLENDNMRIQKLAPDGSNLLTFGGDAGFTDPRQIALGPGGHVYATDLGGAVYRFSSNGAFLGTFGGGRLETPRGIAVDQAGDVYVADRDQFRVDVFSASGQLLRSLSRPLRRGALYAMDVTVDRSGNIWVLSEGEGLVEFSPGGKILTTVSESLRPRDRPANDAYGLVAEPSGNLLVADTQLGRILRFGQGGRVADVLQAVSLSPRAFHAGRPGATVTYILRTTARVRFTVERRARGRYRRLRGALFRRAASGINTFRFKGRIGGRRLRPGRYLLVAKVPGFPPRRARFRIVG